MEPEFKSKNLVSGGPSFGRLVIDKLRETRKEHPALDFAVGNLPIVGGLQTAMDATGPDASPTDAISVLPGGRILKAIVNKLRKAPVGEKPYEVEEIFQKPDLVMTPEER